jgi:uncharacterized protein
MTKPLAIVTGASSGIGEVFAKKLAARGCDLLLVARRKDRLDAAAGVISKEYGVEVNTLAADLASDAGVQALVDRIERSSSLEYLINNAGFGTLGLFWEAPEQGQEQMHRLHVLAAMRLCHAALRGMVPRGRGAIVNVASVAAFALGPANVSYCATKAWMTTFTEGLYLDLKTANSPVRVQALCPGFTYSEFHDTLGTSRDVIPKSLWMSADFVVEDSLRGLDRGELMVVPGWRYKLLVALLRVLPRKLLILGASRRKPRTKAEPGRGVL